MLVLSIKEYFLLQEVCVLQHSSDSVQKPMGPNHDVQKYDPITVFEVLPWYVIRLNILPIVTVISNWFTVLFRWWRTGFGGYGRERPQTNFTTCEENLGEIRVRYKNYVHFTILPDVTMFYESGSSYSDDQKLPYLNQSSGPCVINIQY